MANPRQGDEVEKFIFGSPPNSPGRLPRGLSLLSPSLKLTQASVLASYPFREALFGLFLSHGDLVPWSLDSASQNQAPSRTS